MRLITNTEKIMPGEGNLHQLRVTIKKTLDELSKTTTDYPELITLYVPVGATLDETITFLENEKIRTNYIRADLAKVHAVDSIDRVIQRLKMYEEVPELGLILFCGVVAHEDDGFVGSKKSIIYEVLPPKHVRKDLFMCDDHFHVDILKDMLDNMSDEDTLKENQKLAAENTHLIKKIHHMEDHMKRLEEKLSFATHQQSKQEIKI